MNEKLILLVSSIFSIYMGIYKNEKISFEQKIHLLAENGRKKGIQDGILLGNYVIKKLKIKMPENTKFSIIGIPKNSSVHIGYHFNNSRKILFKDIFYKEYNLGGYTWNGSFDIFALWLLNNRENKSFPYRKPPDIVPAAIDDDENINSFNLKTFYSNMFTKEVIDKLKDNPKYRSTLYQKVTKPKNNIKIKNTYGYVNNGYNTITFVYPQYRSPDEKKEIIDNLYKNEYDTNIVELYWNGTAANNIKPWRGKQV